VGYWNLYPSKYFTSLYWWIIRHIGFSITQVACICGDQILYHKSYSSIGHIVPWFRNEDLDFKLSNTCFVVSFCYSRIMKQYTPRFKRFGFGSLYFVDYEKRSCDPVLLLCRFNSWGVKRIWLLCIISREIKRQKPKPQIPLAGKGTMRNDVQCVWNLFFLTWHFRKRLRFLSLLP
jgi:hypothetical protein